MMMSDLTDGNVFVGSWDYRSFLNDPDAVVTATVDGEEQQVLQLFGYGVISIVAAPMEILTGTIGGEGWELELHGSRSYGNPMTVQFQGKGRVSGAEWIYDYVGYLAPEWPNGVDQTPAMVGSIVRAIPHPSGDGGVSPAGVVASWYAIKRDQG